MSNSLQSSPAIELLLKYFKVPSRLLYKKRCILRDKREASEWPLVKDICPIPGHGSSKMRQDGAGDRERKGSWVDTNNKSLA